MNYPPEMTTTAIKMILSLIFVLAVLWGLYRFTRRGLNANVLGTDGRLIRVLASHYLGIKKSITLVQVPGAVLVLGISADRVNLLSRIKDPELIANLQNRGPIVPRLNFRDQLQRVLHPMQADDRSAVKEIE